MARFLECAGPGARHGQQPGPKLLLSKAPPAQGSVSSSAGSGASAPGKSDSSSLTQGTGLQAQAAKKVPTGSCGFQLSLPTQFTPSFPLSRLSWDFRLCTKRNKSSCTETAGSAHAATVEWLCCCPRPATTAVCGRSHPAGVGSRSPRSFHAEGQARTAQRLGDGLRDARLRPRTRVHLRPMGPLRGAGVVGPGRPGRESRPPGYVGAGPTAPPVRSGCC